MTHRPSQPRTDSPRYLTEERLEIRDLARDFAMTRVLPVANELDPVQGTIPDSLKKEMAEIGFFGIMIPEEYGGLGLGVFEYCLVAEELSRAWMSVSGLLARGNGMGGGFTPEQEQALLPKVARGEYLGAYALSEAEAGSDVANISCRAVRDGDEWVVNGTKMWCTYADEADYMVLFARTDPNKDPAKPHRGISAFLIEKERGGFPEGSRARRSARSATSVGAPGSCRSTITASRQARCSAKKARLLPRSIRPRGGSRSHRRACDRPGPRRTRGLHRIHAHPPPVRPADRRLPAPALQGREDGRRHRGCAPVDVFGGHRYRHRAPLLTRASMCKLVATEMAEQVTSEAVQIHGGAGYTTDFQVERHWRDARLTKIFEGTSEIQMRIISDELLGRPEK